MLKIYQQTIRKPVSFEGIGLHSGKKSKISIYPGEDDQGIIFKRVDLKNNNEIRATYDHVSAAKLCTTLENKNGVKVSTVEHLLAAFYISEIDNAVVEIDNEEVPIMDGSAKEFLEEFCKTGLKQLSKKRKYLKVIDNVEFNDQNKNISIEPSDSSFEVEFELNYKNKIIGKQKNTINFELDNLDEIYSSRTFCIFQDIEKIKKLGLAKGGSLDNAVVVDEEKVLNPGGLRNKKEFVNHKILDLAGDFLLSGHRVIGKVKCAHGGHELTNTFLRKLLNDKSSVSLIEMKDLAVTKEPRLNPSIKLAVSA